MSWREVGRLGPQPTRRELEGRGERPVDLLWSGWWKNKSISDSERIDIIKKATTPHARWGYGSVRTEIGGWLLIHM